MALPGVNKTDSPAGLFPRELSTDIFAKASETSVFQRNAQKTDLPTNGKSIPVLSGDISATWVGETGMKSVTKALPGIKTMDPKKIAVIVPFSMEFVRDMPSYYNTIRAKMSAAFAKAFDLAVVGVNTPAGFGKILGNATAADNAVTADLAYSTDGVAGVLQVVVDNDYDITSWILAKTVEPKLLGAKDLDGRPLVGSSVAQSGSIPTLLGRGIDYTKNLNGVTFDDDADGGTTPAVPLLGVAGDFSMAAWGVAADISYSVSDQATLNIGTEAAPEYLNLWQNNMVAVRAEAEYGFVVGDPKAFVALKAAA